MKELLIEELVLVGEALARELGRRGYHRIHFLGCEESTVRKPALWDRGTILDHSLRPLMALAFPGPPVDEIESTWDTMVSELGRGVTIPDGIARLSLLYPNFSFRSPEGHPTDHRVQMVQLLALAALGHGYLMVEAQHKLIWCYDQQGRGVQGRSLFWGQRQKRHPKNMALSPYKVITARKPTAVLGRLSALAEHLAYALPDMASECEAFVSLVKMAGPAAITKVCNLFEMVDAKPRPFLQAQLQVLHALRTRAEYPIDLILRTYSGHLPAGQLQTLSQKAENDSPYTRDPQIRSVLGMVSLRVAAEKRELRERDAAVSRLISFLAG